MLSGYSVYLPIFLNNYYLALKCIRKSDYISTKSKYKKMYLYLYVKNVFKINVFLDKKSFLFNYLLYHYIIIDVDLLSFI